MNKEMEPQSDTPAMCADAIGDSAEPIEAITPSSQENYIVPVTVEREEQSSTEDTNDQLLAYGASVNVRVICEESNLLSQTTQLIVNDKIGPLRRVLEKATNQPPSFSGQAKSLNRSLNVNDTAEDLRKAITESAKQISLINAEMKKLGEMLHWIPVPGSANTKGEDIKFLLGEWMKSHKEVEKDLRVQVAAKDEQIKQMQEDFRTEIEKTTANARKLNEELTWKNEKERLQAELDKVAQQNKESLKQLNNKVVELQKELDEKKTEMDSLRHDIKWMDEKIKEHEEKEQKQTKAADKWIETMDNEFKKLHEAVQYKGDEIVKVHQEIGEKFSKENVVEKLKEQMSSWDSKLQKSLAKWNNEIDSMHIELTKKADELIRLQTMEKLKQSEISELHNQLKDKDSRIQQLEFERDTLKDKCEAFKIANQTADKCASATDNLASAHKTAMNMLSDTNKKQPSADKQQPEETVEDKDESSLAIVLASPPAKNAIATPPSSSS